MKQITLETNEDRSDSCCTIYDNKLQHLCKKYQIYMRMREISRQCRYEIARLKKDL